MDDKLKAFKLSSFGSYHIYNVKEDKIEVISVDSGRDVHVISIAKDLNIFFETLESLHYFAYIILEKLQALINERVAKQ